MYLSRIMHVHSACTARIYRNRTCLHFSYIIDYLAYNLFSGVGKRFLYTPTTPIFIARNAYVSMLSETRV